MRIGLLAVGARRRKCRFGNGLGEAPGLVDPPGFGDVDGIGPGGCTSRQPGRARPAIRPGRRDDPAATRNRRPLGGGQISPGPGVGRGLGILQLVLELRGRPRGHAAPVPFPQEGTGLLDRQVEALDQHARRAESPVVPALPGYGPGKARQVGRCPAGPPLKIHIRRGESRSRAGITARRTRDLGGRGVTPDPPGQVEGGQDGRHRWVDAGGGLRGAAAGFHGNSPASCLLRVLHGSTDQRPRRRGSAAGPMPSSVTSRQGRSGRSEPFALSVPGRPISRDGLTVAVSMRTAPSL